MYSRKMKKTNKDIKRSLLAVAVTVLAVLLLASPMVNANDGVSVIYGPETISTGGAEETPVIALDSNGNAHLVWVNGSRGFFLMYKMVDPDGNVLIDETRLNPCPDNATSVHVRRPSMVVDSSDKLHIVFHGFQLYTEFSPSGYMNRTDLDASEVIYVKVDPYADDLDGDPANFHTITETPETIISTDDGNKSRAANLDIDSSDRIHVAWWDGDNWNGEAEIRYLVMGTDGSILVTETTLITDINVDIDWGEPEIAIDSSGEAHILYCRHYDNNWDDNNDRELFYFMVDGDNGNILINDTMITVQDDNASVRGFLDVDSAGMVHVVWHDKRLYNLGTGEHELFYSKLDPSLDDQDGDTADPTVISVISEQRITPNDGYKSYLKNLATDPGNRVHVTWVDMYGYTEWGKGEVYYQMLNSEGDQIVSEMNITNFEGNVNPSYWGGSSGRNPDIAATCDRTYITFHGYNETDSSYDIYLIILDVPPCEELPVGGTFGSVDRAYLVMTLTKGILVDWWPLLLGVTGLITGVCLVFYRRRN